MKKTIVIFSLFLLTTAGSVFAQGAGAGKAHFQDFHFAQTVRVQEGTNTVGLDKEGSLKFIVRNGQIMNVMLQNPAGKLIRLAESTDPAEHNPAPNPTCDGNLRCVKNSETNTMVCFCTPDVISSGPLKEVYLTVQITRLVSSQAYSFGKYKLFFAYSSLKKMNRNSAMINFFALTTQKIELDLPATTRLT